jgi:2-polyprenyl-6-hydroxyphenyl methylase / 3-demethylubiquinone-9 3-methyltransferase
MKKTPERIYSRIDNDIYNTEGHRWWDPDFSLSLIRTVFNPVRVKYAKKIIDLNIKNRPGETRVLEVGCGGGILSEEFSKMGYLVSGIDPAGQSLRTAIEHAEKNNLNINYQTGFGENLPFESASFDIVLCCDVLEHVQDLPGVISEISRVLRPGGVFIYDTFNRTFFSKISIIKIMQEWKRWAIMPPGLHVWDMFIMPAEMKALLSQNHFSWKEHRGILPDVSYLKMLRLFHKRAKGKLTYEEFGDRFHMEESHSTRIMYLGWAARNQTGI